MNKRRRNPGLPSRDEIARVLKVHPLVRLREKVKRAFVVGSGATGRQRPDSDIDVLLEVPPVRGLSAGELTDRYRRKIQEYFVKRGIRGRADHLHPQWDGRRVDVYFTYCAEADIDGPAIELTARTANPAPALPGTAGWDPSWVIGVDDSSPNTRTIHILEDDREIGELTLTPSVHIPGAWRIAHALVRRGAERRGLGQAMYLVALRLLGRVHPDWEHSVSPSALRVWQALIRRGLVTGTRPKVFRPLRVVRNAESRGHWDLVFPGDWLGYSQGGATVILFPDGWRGVLDQVYTLRDPSSVPLVKAR